MTLEAPIVLSYLQAMNEKKASDLYLTVGCPPTLRVENELVHTQPNLLNENDIEDIISSILTTRQKHEFDTMSELNTSLDIARYGRFRVNILKQRQHPALVIRRITSDIPTFEELKLPAILAKLSLEKRGLILLTGMTGSGKSTTLAAMVNSRNEQTSGHIITIEDPIEYFHDHKKCVITQREVGIDTESYEIAMKNALRQRPDVILVGEIRDRKVMEHALMSAETGHLCLSTIHTNNSYQAIERIVNLFPEEYEKQVRLNLAQNLKAIVSQRLVTSVGGGLVPAVEVMLNQGLVKELILSGKIGQIRDVMEQNISSGMRTFDQSLLELLDQELITEETAITNADKPSDMKVKLQNKVFSSDPKVAGKKFKPSETAISFYD